MNDEVDRQQRLADHLIRLRAQEAEKRMLHDRTIGGEMVPRPSPEFIEECTGPLKSDVQLQQEAQQAVEREQRQTAIDQQNRQAVEQSLQDRTRAFLESSRAQSPETGRAMDRGQSDDIDI